MPGLRGKIGRVVESITTLEINTLLADGMTGEQMVDPRQGLFDVGEEYCHAVKRLVPGLAEGHPALLGDQSCGSKQAFAALYTVAKQALAAPPANLSNVDRALLQRIKVKSAQVGAMFDRLAESSSTGAHLDNNLSRKQMNLHPRPPPLPLEQDDLVFLRKIWELSTATIAVQTVITLGGDVVSRVQRDLIFDEHTTLLNIHREGISVAVASWSSMIKAIGEFFSSLIRR